MYIPPTFLMDEKDVHLFIQENPFGILVSNSEDGLKATHLPFHFTKTKDSFFLLGHLAGANPHSKCLDENEHLIILNGSHAYVSSSWYKNTNVSTWNYEAIHLYGKVKILSKSELVKALTELTNSYEKDQENPRTMDKIPSKMIEAYLSEIVGFKFTPIRIEAKSKLSQNRNREDYDSIVSHLENQQDLLAKQVANQMKKKRSK